MKAFRRLVLRVEVAIAMAKTRRHVRKTLASGSVREIERLMVVYRAAGLERIADAVEAAIGDPAAFVLDRDSHSWRTKIR